MSVEAGMKRDIPSGSQPEDEHPNQEDVLKTFAANRAQTWAEQGVSDMGAEARLEKENVSQEQRNIAERIENYEKHIDALRQEISEKKSNLINRLLEFRRINDLEKNLGVLGKMKDSAGEDKRRVDELVTAYEYIVRQDEELTSIKAEVKSEMEQQAEGRLAATEQEEKLRSVDDISKRHNCFLVHDIVDAEWKPSANNRAVDTKQLSFDDQLDILLGLDPTIAASTLREGNPKDRTFGKGSWGVFLSGGKVLGGESGDAGTQAHGLRDRRMHSERSQSTEAIDEAITSEYKQGYNELVVEKPEVAGVYIKWTEDMPPLSETTSVRNGNGVRYDRWWEQIQAVAKKNVPIFVLTSDNHTRLIHNINFAEKTFEMAGADIRPEDMVNLPGIYQQHLGEAEKRTAAMRQIDKVQHLLSLEETSDIKNGPVLTEDNMRENSYKLH